MSAQLRADDLVAPVNRATTNQGIYPPRTTSSPRPNDGRRVAFQEDTEEINMYDRSPKVPPKDNTAAANTKASKWQPLSAVEPSPINDNDPFSLGDSEDEKDSKDKPKERKASAAGDSFVKKAEDDDSDRLKQAAAEAMSDNLVDSVAKGDMSATKD